MLYFYSIGRIATTIAFIVTAAIAGFAWYEYVNDSGGRMKKAATIWTVIAALVFVVGVVCYVGYYQKTTQGQAAINAYKSTVTGQTRDVKIYTTTGQELDHFTSSANIDYEDGRVSIQKKDGKRVLVYGSTAIVVVTQP